MNLKSTFLQLVQKYSADENTSEKMWLELETLYTGKNRYYHNLTHLSDLYRELNSVKSKIKDWDITLFTLFYHDAIYQSTKKDNEAKSARLAMKRMREIGMLADKIQQCTDQILATKSHQESSDWDINYFTDADLSILGRNWDTYDQYCKNIRKEYAIYPDFLYSKGRKKVIKHFLSMNRIFKTIECYKKYEVQAKLNLEKELSGY